MYRFFVAEEKTVRQALKPQSPHHCLTLGVACGGLKPIYVIFGFSSPNAPWMKVRQYFPFWTPMLMLVRLALGTVAWWEVVVTVALMLVAISACTWFAARLYRLGVLMYGQRPSLRQLVKLVRMN
jgi:ABC-type Na+ efflux pump permease subunit